MKSTQLLLIYNANIHTLDKITPKSGWMTVLNGRIQQIGNGKPPKVQNAIDMMKQTIVPGFVDAHIHFFQTGMDKLFVDLSDAVSISEIKDLLLQDRESARSWLFARGYEEEKLSDARPLNKEDLDQVSKSRSIWVNRVDYHSAIVNSAGLKRLAIPSDLPGLEMTRGKPTGVLRSEAYLYARRRAIGSYPLDKRKKAIKCAVDECISNGITAVHALEGGSLFGDESVSMVLRNSNNIPMDVTLFLQEKNVYFSERLGFRHIGGCILIDGSIGSYSAALDKPYKNMPKTMGSLYEKTRSLNTFIEDANRVGIQLAFHAIGPRAIELLINSYERALNKCPRFDHRHRIEHFELATDKQIKRASKLGIIASMQPNFEYFWGGPKKMYAARIGNKWRETNRFRTILDAGMKIAGGSDANVTPPDPILGIHSAVNHPNREERISIHEALKMMTIDAAYAAFKENNYGTLSAGKEANFVVLDKDIIKSRKDIINSVQVMQTWYKGKKVFAVTRMKNRGRNKHVV